MTRVLLVSPVGQIGGGEQVLLGLAEQLPKHGMEPLIACMRPGPLAATGRKLGINAFEFGGHRYREIFAVKRGINWLKTLCRTERVDVIHSNHSAHLYSGLAARSLSIPEVWHLHDHPSGLDPIDRINRMIPCSHVIFTTSFVAGGFARLKRRPYSIIAPACNPPAFKPELLGIVKEKFGVNCERPTILTVARMQRHKGHHILIEAAELVRRRRPDVQFVIAGEPHGAEQQSYFQGLHHVVKQKNLQENVRLVGHVSGHELAALYRAVSLLAHCATTEGFGLVLIEAMSAQLPVIAADAEGPASFITDGVNGLLVRRNDPNAAADAILRILNDESLRIRLISGGSSTARQFTVEEMTRRVVEVYESVLKPANSPHD